MKFKLEPGDEVSGTFDNGENWRARPDANGIIAPKDEQISKTLESQAADPNHPIELVKTKG